MSKTQNRDNTKKRVLFLINTLLSGGAEKVLVDLVNQLDKSKYEITVLSVQNKEVYADDLDGSIQYDNIVKCNHGFLNKICTYLISNILPPKVVYKKFINNQYDVEIAFLEGVPTKLLSASPKKKIAWVHTDLCAYFSGNAHKKFVDRYSRYYQLYERILCVSEGSRRGFFKCFGYSDNVAVQYNPVDGKMVTAKMQERIDLEKQQHCLTVIAVGRLSKEKGYDRLLAACKRLKDEGICYQLWIVGEGTERPAMEEYIARNQLEERVTLVGFQDNPYKYMNRADIFVCPSRIEGFGMAITEAMITGLPCVATNCTGTAELLGSSEYGLLVDNSAEGVYLGLKNMLLDAELRNRYKDKAIKRSKDFKQENRIKEIERILDEV